MAPRMSQKQQKLGILVVIGMVFVVQVIVGLFADHSAERVKASAVELVVIVVAVAVGWRFITGRK